jgi:hypothetical protein
MWEILSRTKAAIVFIYFRDRRNNEFVVGMTPLGVTALDYNFASKIGVLRTGLAR